MPDLFLSYAGRDENFARYLTAELERGGAVVRSHTPDQSDACLLLLSPAVRDSLRVQTHIAQALAAHKKFATLIIESTPLDDLLFVLDHPSFELTQDDQAAEVLQSLATHFGLPMEKFNPPDAAVFKPTKADTQAENRVAPADHEALFFAAAELIRPQPGSAIYLYQYLRHHDPDYADGQIGIITDQITVQIKNTWLTQLEQQILPLLAKQAWADASPLINQMQAIQSDHPLTQAAFQQFKEARLAELQTQAQAAGWRAAQPMLAAMRALDAEDERTLQLASLITQNTACDAIYKQAKRAIETNHTMAVATLLGYMRDHCPDYGDPDGLMIGAAIRSEFLHNLRPIARLSEHTGAVQALAFSPDGTLLVSGGADGTLRLWDVEQRQQVAVKRPDDGAILTASYSQDGAFLVTTSANRVLHIWSMPEASEAVSLDQFEGTITSAIFTPDAAHLICGYNDGRLEIIRIEDGNIIVSVAAHAYEINRLLLASDGKRLLTGSDDRLVKLWQFSENPFQLTENLKLEGHTMLVNDADLSEDRIASVANDGTLKLWDATTGAEIWSMLHTDNAQARAVSFAPHAPLLVTGAVDRMLRFWDVDTGALLASQEAHGAAIITLAFAPDGATLATGSSDRSIILWQLG